VLDEHTRLSESIKLRTCSCLALSKKTIAGRTRLSDRADPVPDEVWNEAARHYDEPALASLVLAIANINVWNRLNVATRQVAGEWRP
jgi:alkylhydroperoxidase family enzyme